MAKENVELMHECFPEHFLIWTARMKHKEEAEKTNKGEEWTREAKVDTKQKNSKA